MKFEHINSNNSADDSQIAEGGILTPKKDGCNEINTYVVLNRLTGEAYEYNSIDKPLRDGPTDGMRVYTADQNIEFLNTQQPANFPPHRLVLKEGAIVMFTRNIDQKAGICNGTRGVVVKCGNICVKVKLMTGPPQHRGKIVTVTPCRYTHGSQRGETGVKFERIQLPLILAFAMTINKSQGKFMYA